MPEVLPPFVNSSLNKENAVSPNPKIFEIRSHHLRNLCSLNYLSPEKLAGIMTSGNILLHKEIEANPNGPMAQHKGYAQDIFGLSLEHIQEYQDRTKRFFELILTLPDDHPAEIVEGIQDMMCNACAIGEHCKRLIRDDPRGNGKTTNTLEFDRKYTEKFIKALDNLALPKPTIIYGQAQFSDAEPQDVRRVKTTIGVIRQVLKQTTPAFW